MFWGFVLTSFVSLLIGALLMRRFGLTRVVERGRATDQTLLALATAQIAELVQTLDAWHRASHHFDEFETCGHSFCRRAFTVGVLAQMPTGAPVLNDAATAVIYDFENEPPEFLFSGAVEAAEQTVAPIKRRASDTPAAARATITLPRVNTFTVSRETLREQSVDLRTQVEPVRSAWLVICGLCRREYNAWESSSRYRTLYCSAVCETRAHEADERESAEARTREIEDEKRLDKSLDATPEAVDETPFTGA